MRKVLMYLSVVLFFGLVGYYMGEYKEKFEKTTETQSEIIVEKISINEVTSEKKIETTEETETTQDILDEANNEVLLKNVSLEMVNKLMEYVPNNWSNFKEYGIYAPNAYQNKRITYFDLDSSVVLAGAFRYIDKEDTIAVPEQLHENNYIFDKSVMEEAVHKIYGPIGKINHVSFETLPGAGCYYDNETGQYKYDEGGGGYYRYNISKVILARKDITDINIYVRYMMITTEAETDETNTTYVTGYSVYTNSLCNKKIGDLPESIDIRDDYLIDDLVDKYEGDMGVFKHTFRQNSKGEYYWYSTDVV